MGFVVEKIRSNLLFILYYKIFVGSENFRNCLWTSLFAISGSKKNKKEKNNQKIVYNVHIDKHCTMKTMVLAKYIVLINVLDE